MDEAENNIRLTVEAYISVYGQRPKITLSIFKDATLQLFLSVPDQVVYPHAQGDGPTLLEASVALRKALAKRLRTIREELDAKLTKHQEQQAIFFAKLDVAATSVEVA